ncbi:MAG TPA: glutamate-5-semialdehyde dehydrogenase [Candidatus Ventrousia excrementavium]|uniref:Gamma-glutamyl phosphate reductase n=1 Tax=Candidatus Ventrousia excrementavium TaxID=2840961 RepID=A0A9D1LLR6_9CLOT|nr:glutamate-5-semialdehyde dehydrogenase [Candidatus Ventrousia excrementavium]
MTDLRELAVQAKEAARVLAGASEERKNRALENISDALLRHQDEILAANRADCDAARADGMSDAMLDRLTLTGARLERMAAAVRKVRDLPDPVGEVMEERVLENGLQLSKVRVPLGVVGIIYESRPNVTVDAAVLCLKSGNAAFLRGGSESIRSNIALERVMREALAQSGLPQNAVTLVHDTSRETASQMMQLRGLIDVLIPRGGAGLIAAVVRSASVPVIETGTGNCHVYVHEKADLRMAVDIIVNAKAQRVSVCNAAETLLVDEAVADNFLPMAQKALSASGVALRGCERTRAILEGAAPADDDDWAREYLDYILAVRVVQGLDEAISHIARYSTGHSECIVTQDAEAAARFLREIDAAAVYHNASTRFTDGEEFGMGAEIGISTQKMHARGPMGLRELCSYKYIVRGSGQIRL